MGRIRNAGLRHINRHENLLVLVLAVSSFDSLHGDLRYLPSRKPVFRIRHHFVADLIFFGPTAFRITYSIYLLTSNRTGHGCNLVRYRTDNYTGRYSTEGTVPVPFK